jgi:hypothetical protein
MGMRCELDFLLELRLHVLRMLCYADCKWGQHASLSLIDSILPLIILHGLFDVVIIISASSTFFLFSRR